MSGDRRHTSSGGGAGRGALAAALVLLLAGGPAAAQPAPGPGGPALPPGIAPVTGPPASEALFARVDALAVELTEADRAVAAEETAAAPLTDARRSAEAVERQRAEADEAAQRRLAALAVSAYTSGGVVPAELTAAMLTTRGFSVDHEHRLVLARTAAARLRDDRRATGRALAEATAVADRARAADEAAQRLVRAARARRDGLAADLAATRTAAEEARAAEELERFLFELWKAERRAATPRPRAHRSGVVPPPLAPADLVARLAGTMPRTSLEAYWRAATRLASERPDCHLDWALLAGIGHVETGHGTHRGAAPAADGGVEPTIIGPELDGNGFERITDTDQGVLDGDPIMDRAVGPMQFIPTSWRAYGVDGNGDRVADPHNIYDAALAAGHYLCRNGRGDLRVGEVASRAVLSYNRSWAYVGHVLGLADHYRRVADPEQQVPPPPLDPDQELPVRPPVGEPPGDPPPASTTTTSTTTTSTTTTTAPPG